MRRLKNVVIFFQTILSFVLSRKNIKKAFLQIPMIEDQLDFLRMVWYENVFAQNPTGENFMICKSSIWSDFEPFYFKRNGQNTFTKAFT